MPLAQSGLLSCRHTNRILRLSSIDQYLQSAKLRETNKGMMRPLEGYTFPTYIRQQRSLAGSRGR